MEQYSNESKYATMLTGTFTREFSGNSSDDFKDEIVRVGLEKAMEGYIGDPVEDPGIYLVANMTPGKEFIDQGDIGGDPYPSDLIVSFAKKGGDLDPLYASMLWKHFRGLDTETPDLYLVRDDHIMGEKEVDLETLGDFYYRFISPHPNEEAIDLTKEFAEYSPQLKLNGALKVNHIMWNYDEIKEPIIDYRNASDEEVRELEKFLFANAHTPNPRSFQNELESWGLKDDSNPDRVIYPAHPRRESEEAYEEDCRRYNMYEKVRAHHKLEEEIDLAQREEMDEILLKGDYRDNIDWHENQW